MPNKDEVTKTEEQVEEIVEEVPTETPETPIEDAARTPWRR
jgi:hypothetical protein